MPIVYLNGEFVPAEEAKLSVLDRGFLFGDGIYEVIPIYHGKPFRLQEHLGRLENSLREVRMDNPHNREEWEKIILELVEKNAAGQDYAFYLQITRGIAPRDHVFPNNTAPTVFMMCNPLTGAPSEVLTHGIVAITEIDTRWNRCNIKSISLLANVLHRQNALEQDAKEAILIRDGLALEGAASNLFVVVEGRVETPPKGTHILPGITRDLLLEISANHNIPAVEVDIPENRLHIANEIFVTSSTKEIMPITKLDGKPVGSGKPGKITLELHQLLQDFKANLG